MSRVLPILVAVCVFVVIMQHVDAQCFSNPITSIRRNSLWNWIYGRRRYRPGNEWLDNRPGKCLKCRCSTSGWSCCSTTISITVLDDDARCINVVQRCRNVWVVKGQPNRRCPTGWIPTNISAVGKK